MDLTKKENDFKIVEYNCWNASGLYSIDMVKLFIKTATNATASVVMVKAKHLYIS